MSPQQKTQAQNLCSNLIKTKDIKDMNPDLREENQNQM